jgi:hypothetical protein
MTTLVRSLLFVALLIGAGCGARSDELAAIPIPLGHGAKFLPAAIGHGPAPAQECGPRPRTTYGAHVELFAGGRVVQVPAGIGVAPPVARHGAYVTAGRCWHALYTTEPTGLIHVAAPATLGALFDVWRQPLSRTRLVGFSGRVRAFVAGREWRGDPRAIPLARHAQIVLELGPFVPPHPAYRFPPGL